MSNYAQTIDTLNAFVRTECKELIANGQTQLIIKEDKPEAKNRLDKIYITDFKGKFACFIPDKSSPEFCCFLEKGKPQKACDSIIFTQYQGKNYIIICELKSGSLAGVTTQLKNTKVIVDLLSSLCLNHHQINISEWNVRYVVVAARPIKKRTTRLNLTSGTSPIRPREISVSNGAKIELGRLCIPVA